MGTLLRYLLLGATLFFVLMIVLRPRQFRTLGQKLRLVGLLYVAAVLLSAAARYFLGWGVY